MRAVNQQICLIEALRPAQNEVSQRVLRCCAGKGKSNSSDVSSGFCIFVPDERAADLERVVPPYQRCRVNRTE